jgi:hypothetical protein
LYFRPSSEQDLVSPVMRLEDAKSLLRTIEEAGEIDIQAGLPLFRCQVFQRQTRDEDACIVEQQVDLPVMLHGFGE